MEEGRKWKAVYTIVEQKKEGVDQKFWFRIGTSFVNKDESINVKLDALPVNGTLHIRDMLPNPKKEG